MRNSCFAEGQPMHSDFPELVLVIGEPNGEQRELIEALAGEGWKLRIADSIYSDIDSNSACDIILLCLERLSSGVSLLYSEICLDHRFADKPIIVISDRGLEQSMEFSQLLVDASQFPREVEILYRPYQPSDLVLRIRMQLELFALRKALVVVEEGLRRERKEKAKVEAALLFNEKRLDALLGLSGLRNQTEDRLNDYVLEASVRLTDSKLGYLHFVNHEETGFESYVWSQGADDTCGTQLKAMDFSIETAGLWADSLRLRKPSIHNDYLAIPVRKGLPMGHLPISRIMSVPILKEEKVVAILGVANKPYFYDEADLRQLQLFGNQLWSILETKRMEISLAKANEELQ